MTGISNETYKLFQKHKELTDMQLQQLLKVNPNSIRPVRLKLEQMGLIVRTTAKKNHKRGRISTNKTGQYTIYKLVNNPKKVKSMSTIQLKIYRTLVKVRQIESSLVNLLKGV